MSGGRILALAAVLLTAGCAGSAPAPKAPLMAEPGRPGAAAPVPALGDNMVGEPCRLVAVPPRDGKDRAQSYDIMCGTWEAPSGRVVVASLYETLPEDDAAYRSRLQREQTQTPWASEVSQRMICQPPAWSDGPLGRPLLMSSCLLRSGNWPQVTLVTGRGTALFQADGIPAVSEVILRAVEQLAAGGGKPVEERPQARADAIRQLQATLGAQALRFGRGDLSAFERLIELGRLNNSIEDYRGAEEAYRSALQIQTRVLGDASVGAGETLMALALEVSNQGRYDEADALFRRAEPLLAGSFDKAARARMLSYRSYDAGNAGDLRRAIALARESNAARRAQVADLDNTDGAASNASLLGSLVIARGELVHGLMLEATMALRLEQVGVAEAAIVEARQLYDRTRGLPAWWQGRIRTIQGNVLAAKGNVERGVVLLKQAVQSDMLLFGESWPVVSRLLELAKLQSEADLDSDAVATFRDALALLAKDTNPPSQLGYDRIAPLLKSAVALAELQPEQKAALAAEMFEAVQLVRDGVVGQTVTRASARYATNDPKVAELVRAQQEAGRERDRLRLELADETAKPDKERDRTRADELSKRLAESTLRSAELERDLQAAFPGYARITRYQPLPASQVSAVLGEDEALVSYSVGRTGSFGFLVRRDGVSAFPVALSARDLADQVGELRKAFAPVQGRLRPFDLQASHELYKALLGPVQARLEGVRRLVVVPAGALSALPPAVLVTEAPAAGGDPGAPDYRAARWLARSTALTVSPSIRAFMTLRSQAAGEAAPKPFLGFGDPPFKGLQAKAAAGKPDGGTALDALGQECRTGAPINPELLRSLAPLPETAGELKRVSALLGGGNGSVVTGGAVTKAAVRDGGLDQYRVLYFATHGLLPGELRCQSEPGLALAPPDKAPADTADDGLLTSSDIASLKLRAELVVLSACNTAGGGAGRFGGEALSGLAESFFFAGSRALLVTHWQVPSAATVTLTTTLFERLAKDGALRTPDALAAAQLVLADTAATAHPYFWGAFTLVGDGGAARLAPAGRSAAVSPPAHTPPAHTPPAHTPHEGDAS